MIEYLFHAYGASPKTITLNSLPYSNKANKTKCYCCKGNTEQLDLQTLGNDLEQRYSRLWVFKTVPKTYGCQKCGHIFTGCPDDFNPEDFYCNEYRSENKNAFYEETVREKYEKRILAQLKSETPDFKPNSILEVGSGIGSLLQRTLKDFSLNPDSATTCELNKNHTEDLGKQGFNSIFGDFMSVDFKRKFDLFIAIDIIEHIEDVSALPQKIKQLISKDGLGLIQVPARRSIKTFTEHFHYFNPYSFFELFKNTFEIVSIFENGMNETSNGPALLGIIKN